MRKHKQKLAIAIAVVLVALLAMGSVAGVLSIFIPQ
jgi:hypothetical protein